MGAKASHSDTAPVPHARAGHPMGGGSVTDAFAEARLGPFCATAPLYTTERPGIRCSAICAGFSVADVLACKALIASKHCRDPSLYQLVA